MSGIRVAIFDDSDRVRDATGMLVGGTEGFEMTGSFSSANTLVDDLSKSKPDVVLMDIDMPGINGIEAMKLIKKHFPGIQVLMQTAFDDDDKIFNAICAGAGGYILKKTPPAQILESIREVYNGGAPMTPSIAHKVLHMFSTMQVPSNEKKEDYGLSRREAEVLSLLVNGKSYKMIADELFISYETVRAHMKKVYEKLHVSSMTEAVAKAINQKLF